MLSLGYFPPGLAAAPGSAGPWRHSTLVSCGSLTETPGSVSRRIQRSRPFRLAEPELFAAALPSRAPGWKQKLVVARGFQNKNRVAILAELDKEKRKLLMQNQSSTNHPGASIALARSPLNKDFRDHAEQQHIAAQQKAALQHAHAHSSGYFITQDSAFGNLILPVLPRLEAE
ncbi:hypothetical protein WISP_64156 [Willisornis vidua]|uniref:SOSS complex subunit C n=118 Tax=Aves TaxID=8782 RepID=A0ABQ9D9L6_9PASS|nr:hypothetical protein WISP_64156 [Willisornis vidua]